MWSTFGEEGTGRGRRLPTPSLLYQITVLPPTASVPTTILLYSGPLLCGFNMSVIGLTHGLPQDTDGQRVLFKFNLNPLNVVANSYYYSDYTVQSAPKINSPKISC